jgi:hypothetical protein
MSKTIIVTIEVDLESNQLSTQQYNSLYAHAHSAVRSALDTAGIDFDGYRVHLSHTESLALTDR